MNTHAEEPEEGYDYEPMAEAVNKMTFMAFMMADYYEVCPHCLAIAVAKAVAAEVTEGDEPKQEHRPQ